VILRSGSQSFCPIVCGGIDLRQTSMLANSNVAMIIVTFRKPNKYLQLGLYSKRHQPDLTDAPTVEIFFMLKDVKHQVDLRRWFIKWVVQMCVQLRAKQYYARYECWSWRVGNVAPGSGVFLVGGAQDANA